MNQFSAMTLAPDVKVPFNVMDCTCSAQRQVTALSSLVPARLSASTTAASASTHHCCVALLIAGGTHQTQGIEDQHATFADICLGQAAAWRSETGRPGLTWVDVGS